MLTVLKLRLLVYLVAAGSIQGKAVALVAPNILINYEKMANDI